MTDLTFEMSGRRPKSPQWTRTLDVILRTAHVAVTSVLFGGAVFGVSFHLLSSWFHAAVGTGCALVASEVYHCRHWPYQGRGVLSLTHAALTGLVLLRPELAVPLLTAVLISGMVGSHMPKFLRYWSFVHGRVVPPG